MAVSKSKIVKRPSSHGLPDRSWQARNRNHSSLVLEKFETWILDPAVRDDSTQI